MGINIKNILGNVTKAFRTAFPDVTEHYIGGIGEGISPPAFGFFPVYFDGKRMNAHYVKRKAEVQIVFFEKRDGYSKRDKMAQIMMAERICGLLDSFRLNVEGRTLHFTYEQGEADEQLAFYLRTEWMERKDTPEFEAAEKTDAAETVGFTERVREDGKGSPEYYY